MMGMRTGIFGWQEWGYPAIDEQDRFKPGDRARIVEDILYSVDGVTRSISRGTIVKIISPPQESFPRLWYVFFAWPEATRGWLSILGEYLEPVEASVTHLCHCPTDVMVARGCQCGGK